MAAHDAKVKVIACAIIQAPQESVLQLATRPRRPSNLCSLSKSVLVKSIHSVFFHRTIFSV